MRAILLSAGQGRRLLPYTRALPKCLLPVQGEEPLLALQLEALARCGISRATVVVGYRGDLVEAFLARRAVPGLVADTLFNPFFGLSDNLVSCWLARESMDEDFVLLNGDTLFEDAVLSAVLDARPGDVHVAVDRKGRYDADDMKVSLTASGRLRRIGKALAGSDVQGEAVGLTAFRGSGPKQFASALERSIRRPGALRRWYVSALTELARDLAVETTPVEGLWWREVDSPEDLVEVRKHLGTVARERSEH